MFKALLSKLKESFFSVIPIVAIVFILSLTPLCNFEPVELIVFFSSAVSLIVGIALFNLGADIAMSPMGENIGVGLTKTRNLKLLFIVCFIMGLLITIAEPDLSVLAEQTRAIINGTVLIVVVGIGVGMFLLFAVLKIVTKTNLSLLLMFFYMLLFALCTLILECDKSELIPLAFDSGGVTTGPITVPFIMALGVGIATTIGGHEANENSFGLIALCSIGPMLAVTVLSLLSKGNLHYDIPDYSMNTVLEAGILNLLGSKAIEVIKALAFIILFFFILQFTVLHLPKAHIKRILIGIVYTFIGLVVFLSSVSLGFMPIGYKLGTEMGSSPFVVLFAFIIGMVVVLAEPAVHVLNKQVESITGGTVKKSSMMIALSLGVGISIGLSIVRIIAGFSILYYLIPGYFLSLALSLFVPRIYTAIAFDSGGVASGPLTSSFILPFAIGVCTINGGNVLSEAFGIVAMVAMTPLITIQTLGFRAIVARIMRERVAMKRILDKDDEQIIYFE